MNDHALLRWDLNEAAYTPTDCPDWARVVVPDWVRPYQGKNGSPEPWYSQEGSLCGGAVRGIDRYHANHYVAYRPETAGYLYDRDAGYTPLQVQYRQGSLPGYERVVGRYTDASMTQAEKAISLLTRAMPEVMRHPKMPPLGQPVPPDRNLMDEDLLASGSGWCNEQARVFVRLCQVVGIQARLIHLFGQNHTVAEFFVDGGWAMADTSWFFVARSDAGELLSAADCHDGGAGQRAYATAKARRFQQLASMSDQALNISGETARRERQQWATFDAEELAGREDLFFGVVNYPLPPQATVSN